MLPASGLALMDERSTQETPQSPQARMIAPVTASVIGVGLSRPPNGASSTPSGSSPKIARMSAALRAGGSPWRLALVETIGPPKPRQSAADGACAVTQIGRAHV